MARLTYTQIASFLTSAYAQATGGSALASLSFDTLQQVFSTDSYASEDNLYAYLDNVIAKTLFAVRPISEPLRSLEWTPSRYGDIVRKLSPITVEPVNNREWDIGTELQQVNPDFACCTAPQLQDFLATRIGGGNTFSRKWTTFRDQMNAAFHSEREVVDFFSMLTTERTNRMKLDRLSEKRALVNNAILALYDYGSNSVFNALTEYNTETGSSYTATTIMQPGVFREFMIWLAAKIEFLRKLMQENGKVFHIDITGKELDRHTPLSMQKLYLQAEFEEYFRANQSQLFNPEYLPKFAAVESVAYWQNPLKPRDVQGTAESIDPATGNKQTITTALCENVIGILFDDDFMGLSNISNWSAPEPYNARYGFQNTWYHSTYRSITDFTENALLIRLA